MLYWSPARGSNPSGRALIFQQAGSMSTGAPTLLGRIFLLALALIWLATAPVQAEVYLVQPGPGDNNGGDPGTSEAGKDCFVSQLHPGSNFNQYNLVSGRNSGNDQDPALGGNSRTYIQFDVYNLTDSVRRVVLMLRAFTTDGYAAQGSLAAYQVMSGWSETGLTWNNQPSVVDQPVARAPINSWGQWVELDITQAYLNWKQGWPQQGLMLDTEGSDQEGECTRQGEAACRPGEFHSSDSEKTELRPLLVIHPYYDPVPGDYSDQDLAGTWNFASGVLASLTINEQGLVTALAPRDHSLRALGSSQVFITTDGRITGLVRWTDYQGELFQVALAGRMITREALTVLVDGSRSDLPSGGQGEVSESVTGIKQ